MYLCVSGSHSVNTVTSSLEQSEDRIHNLHTLSLLNIQHSVESNTCSTSHKPCAYTERGLGSSPALEIKMIEEIENTFAFLS